MIPNMLLFVKKPFADALAAGRKTIELRCGARYRSLTPGRIVSVNGQRRYKVLSVHQCDDPERLLDALLAFFDQLGFDTPEQAFEALLSCYSEPPLPAFFLSLSPI